MKRLLLIGGGHAHLFVLEQLARVSTPGTEVVMVTPSAQQGYSGMLPGWMAGHYERSQCQIDLRPLAVAASARLELGHVCAMNADRRCVRLDDGREIAYDVASIDVGSATDLSWLGLAGAKLLAVKPLEAFFSAWPQVLAAARARGQIFRLVVVGAGAAGIELALAARYAFARIGVDAAVSLVGSDSGFLTDHAPAVRRHVLVVLARAQIAFHRGRAVGVEQGLMLSNGQLLSADSVIAATGARAHDWLKRSGLACDESGFVEVDRYQRSVSHPNVFAAGDVCSRHDVEMPRSGTHAVHSGPVLAVNLLAALQGGTMRSYVPRRRSLYLISCGARYAVASWGRWSAKGDWVWRCKDLIDRRFIRRFSRPASAGSPKA
ncbi:FAD-dependent oxidoreductase [Duganella sp. FT3S]|uniref:FAD-dependent oxidoreductase n=1 Tax=Rugamonas fusca TaxID=2758568 RepID=A0A7W2EEB8_9BURK|nr:FAD-dependent oxidoreductase [Rugamonas fusca]MBA5604212.1 FAD-dependent oxidoreductase [Rugamonas fusca]